MTIDANSVIAPRALATGPVATVYMGRLMGTGDEVAVKMFATKFDRDTASRLDRERAALDTVRSVRSILPIDDLVEHDGRSGVRMELCQGSIAGFLSVALAVPDVLRVGVAVATALAAAHRVGVVHGGVTPDNVLYRRTGELVLADFGLALRERFPRDPMLALQYTAPETLRDDTRSAASDLYGLGAVLYTALTGAPPFPRRAGEPPGERILRVLREEVPPVRGVGVPAELSVVIDQLLAKDPATRPSDAASVAGLFESLQRGTPAPAPVPVGNRSAPPVDNQGGDPDDFDFDDFAEVHNASRETAHTVAPTAPPTPTAPPMAPAPMTPPMSAGPPMSTAPQMASAPQVPTGPQMPQMATAPLMSTGPQVPPTPTVPRGPTAPPSPTPPMAPTPTVPPSPTVPQVSTGRQMPPTPVVPPGATAPPMATGQQVLTGRQMPPTPAVPPGATVPPNPTAPHVPTGSQMSPVPTAPTPTVPPNPPVSLVPPTPTVPRGPAAPLNPTPPPMPPIPTVSPTPSAPQMPAVSPPLQMPTVSPPPAIPSVPSVSTVPMVSPGPTEPSDQTVPVVPTPSPRPPEPSVPFVATVPTPRVVPMEPVPPGGRVLLHTTAGSPPAGTKSRKRWRVGALVGIGVVVAGVTAIPLVLGKDSPQPHGEPSAVAEAPASVSVEAPKALIELAPPNDQGSQVELTWRAEGDLDFAVVVAGEQIDTMTLVAHRQRTMRVPVDLTRKYCFQVRGTDGRQIYSSDPIPIRGAHCKI
ncbi:protein kinase domain-containing protein [Actinocrispum wychmicini]|nr:protein kinase [Actinocrispum wychmicini]